MGKSNKNKKRTRASLTRKSKGLEIKKEGLNDPPKLVFGFSMLDINQGQNYKDWEESEILSKALLRIQGLCSMTAKEAKQQQIIKEYGNEIPKGSDFERPKHIPEDIKWASIRIQGKERIIGYLEDNYIFQVVFLDKEHSFYPSKKKNT